MRRKLKRFQDNAQRDNVIEPGKDSYQGIKGHWQEHCFHNDHDIILELGCGNGEYTVNLAHLFPAKNCIGVDLKGARLWKGSTAAINQKLTNAAFLRTPIEQLDSFFEEGEVTEIYIPFPDPRPRQRDTNKRLTSPSFLNVYRNILKPGGYVHLKTDNEQLFLYTLEVLQQQSDIYELVHTDNLYQSHLLSTHYGIQTKYETKFINQGLAIKYVRFRLGTEVTSAPGKKR
jgi:tRNA (guanine-N7-)-methyltransferase